MKIEFHFGVPHKLAYTCRLLRKAARAGAKVWVLGDAASIQRLDVDLWSISATDFVTHCFQSAPVALQNRSCAVLATEMDASCVATQGRNVLVNVSQSNTVPDCFEQFSRVIEIVSTDETDRQCARQRWRQYAQQGHTLQKYDVQATEGS